MQALNSYSQFLEEARNYQLNDLNKEQWEQQIQQGKYYKYYRDTKPGIYVLDFTQGQYVYCNEVMASYADYPIHDLMTGGLNLALKLWHPNDLKAYDQHILPANLAFLKNKAVADYSNYLFTCNYRVRQRKGNYRMVEQTSFFSKSIDNGMPLMTIGFLRDITNRVLDNSILHTIEEINSYNNKLVFRQVINPEPNAVPLSPREIEILELVAIGKSNSEIASELQISRWTVENHRKTMLRKMDAQNMVQVAIKAYQVGLILQPMTLLP